MTKSEVVKMGVEFERNMEKYHEYVTKTYKYNGKVKTRQELVMTKEGEEIFHVLANEEIFRCPCCGEMKTFIDLEFWSEDEEEDLMNDKVICSLCYEEDMGEDL